MKFPSLRHFIAYRKWWLAQPFREGPEYNDTEWRLFSHLSAVGVWEPKNGSQVHNLSPPLGRHLNPSPAPKS